MNQLDLLGQPKAVLVLTQSWDLDGSWSMGRNPVDVLQTVEAKEADS